MNNIKIKIINQLKDNYSYILFSNSNAVIIDPANAEDHINYLEKKNLTPECIILTHHHKDHTAGINNLIKKYESIKVYSSNKSIIETTNLIKEKDKISTKINSFNVIETPGHTLDHIILFDSNNKILFSGDTLFHCGCGRIFEGTFKQMYNSLQKINELPDDTLVYCGHEYTITNLNFLDSVFDKLPELLSLRNEINKKLTHSSRSIPFSLGVEKKINPFLNPASFIFDEFKETNNLSNFDLFSLIRKKKDEY